MSNNPVKWSAREAVVHAVTSAALKNLGANNHALGGEIDNSAGHQYADFELYVRGADVFHAGDYVAVWFVNAADGTNYEDGSAGTPGVNPGHGPDIIFYLRLVNTQQRIVERRVNLPSGKFKCLVKNVANHGFTNTDDENVLDYFAYNDNIVSA